jgi:tetratricopeptide (TPR) repeat protein
LKTKYALSIIVIVAGNAIRTQADEASPTRRAFAQLNYPSLGATMNKGVELADKGDYDKARQLYDAAIAQDPKAWPLYLNRCNVFVHQRKFDLAIQDLNTVLRLAPGILLAQVLRGILYEHLGDYSRALADYDRLVSITSSLPLNRAFAQNSRAWLRATCPNASFRNGKQAVTDAKSACNETSWRETAYIDTLAAAHAEVGDFNSAVQFEQQAIKGAREDAWGIKDPARRRAAYERQLALYQRRLAAYERQQPWRSNSH